MSTAPIRLAVFDCDGTLVDGQADICAAMEAAFAEHGLRAPERTTEEFIRDALSSKKLTDAHRDLVAGYLEQSDLVKFARHAPGPTDMHNALDSAERLVRETMPVEAPPAKPPYVQEEDA